MIQGDVLEIVNDVRRVEVDIQDFQPGAIDGNWKEASDSRDAGVLLAWESEVKALQLRQGYSEVCDVIVIQPKGALALAAANHYFQGDQIPKHLDRGGEGDIDNGGGRRDIDTQVF